MESADNIYDLTALLEKQKIDFFLVTVRDNKKDEVVDIFYNVNSINTYNVIGNVGKNCHEEIQDMLGPEYADPHIMEASHPNIFSSEDDDGLDFDFDIEDDEEDKD